MAALPRKSTHVKSDRISAAPEMASYLKVLAPVLTQQKTSFESATLSLEPVRSLSEAVKALKSALHGESVRAELTAFTARLGGVQSEAFWDEYFRAYDKTVGLSDGYLEMTLSASRQLSPKGQLLDIGAGTGNYSAQLLHGSRFRKVTAVDLSRVGLQAAREKARLLCNGELSRFQAKQANLRLGLHGLGQKFDGAVLGNVLYNIPKDERPKIIKQVFNVLNPGAELVLTDPLPHIQKDEAQLERFLTRVIVDAVLNGSRVSPAEIGLVAHMNAELLVGKTPAYVTARELSEMLLSAGFQIFERRLAYYDACSFICARRPVLPRRQ